jgi:hypothetical protein
MPQQEYFLVCIDLKMANQSIQVINKKLNGILVFELTSGVHA